MNSKTILKLDFHLCIIFKAKVEARLLLLNGTLYAIDADSLRFLWIAIYQKKKLNYNREKNLLKQLIDLKIKLIGFTNFFR